MRSIEINKVSRATAFLFCLALLLVSSIPAFPQSSGRSRDVSLIPQPLSLTRLQGSFKITSRTTIATGSDGPELRFIAEQLANDIQKVTGYSLKVKSGQGGRNSIQLSIKQAPDSLGEEGYVLSVSPEKVLVTSLKPQGAFYGTQTIRQLLPLKSEVNDKSAEIPAVMIVDRPRFGWRGMMLDVGRHYYPLDFVKKSIDFLASHKMNIFHWHLTDDQGWRIEIKKHPKLIEIGSKRNGTMRGSQRTYPVFENKPEEGFYTQEEIREVIDYAKQRYITVIPEIEMPGHSVAALASYPELSCTGGPFQVAQTWGIFQDVYCAGNEQTFKFLEEVLTEVAALFPSSYIHIGGDEAPKNRWKACPKCQARIKSLGLKDENELQSYFIRRMEKYLAGKGKKIIGWDEILEGGLAPNATVMSWRGTKGGIAAAKLKHDVIMSPNKPFYLDHHQGDRVLEPVSSGTLNSLFQVYAYDPVPSELTEEEQKYIKGAQGNLWSEFIFTTSHAEYMIFPRLSAISEVVWTLPANKNWDDFTRRMEKQYSRYRESGINFAESAYTPWYVLQPDGDKLRVTIKTDSYSREIRFTTDGTAPVLQSVKYEGPLLLDKPMTIKAANFKNGKQVGKVSERAIVMPVKAKE